MKTISYMVELTTQIPITVLDEAPKEDTTFYEVLINKTQEVMDTIDFNQQEYQMRVVSEVREA